MGDVASFKKGGALVMIGTISGQLGVAILFITIMLVGTALFLVIKHS